MGDFGFGVFQSNKISHHGVQLPYGLEMLVDMHAELSSAI